MFWVFAAGALFVASFIALAPLLRGKSFWQPAAVALIFALPATGLWLYNSTGTPGAIDLEAKPQPQVEHAMQGGDMEAMLANLRKHLEQSPEDLDSWMLLARTLKTMQRYPEALDALQKARELAPQNPYVMVELAEARVFTSTNGHFDTESVALLEQALDIDPNLQKALWLMGVASAQAGDDAFAISYWQSLLDLLEAGSPVANSVQQQISEAQARMGMEPDTVVAAAPAAEVTAAGGWQGTPIRVTASEAAQGTIPQGAVLFVIIRSTGAAAGPPLGVRRVADPVFPLEFTLTDQDSMMQQRLISSEPAVRLEARISQSGSPTAQSGDWHSAGTEVALADGGAVELVIDQQVE